MQTFLGVAYRDGMLATEQAASMGFRPCELALNTAAINRLVAEYGHLAGLAPIEGPNRLSPHDLRRTCGRTAYDNGAPLPLMQQL